MPDSKRLLIVDDDPDVGAFVRDAAEPLGFVVESYVHSRDFKAAVMQADADVMIIDINMPETDGIELLRFLAAQRTKAKIVIMSGFDERYQKMAATLGATNGLSIAKVVNKPVRLSDFRSVLSSLISD